MSNAYDDKNAEDFLAVTRDIENGLGSIRNDLHKISYAKINKTELARRSGCHPNTITNRIKDGATWIVNDLESLKVLWKETQTSQDEDEAPEENDPIQELESKLDLQRKETAKAMAQSDYFRAEYHKAKDAVKRLAKQKEELEKALEYAGSTVVPLRKR